MIQIKRLKKRSETNKENSVPNLPTIPLTQKKRAGSGESFRETKLSWILQVNGGMPVLKLFDGLYNVLGK